MVELGCLRSSRTSEDLGGCELRATSPASAQPGCAQTGRSPNKGCIVHCSRPDVAPWVHTHDGAWSSTSLPTAGGALHWRRRCPGGASTSSPPPSIKPLAASCSSILPSVGGRASSAMSSDALSLCRSSASRPPSTRCDAPPPVPRQGLRMPVDVSSPSERRRSRPCTSESRISRRSSMSAVSASRADSTAGVVSVRPALDRVLERVAAQLAVEPVRHVGKLGRDAWRALQDALAPQVSLWLAASQGRAQRRASHLSLKRPLCLGDACARARRAGHDAQCVKLVGCRAHAQRVIHPVTCGLALELSWEHCPELLARGRQRD
eukprot:scaffold676_cov115-Isochrysis_galbana.AAC.12